MKDKRALTEGHMRGAPKDRTGSRPKSPPPSPTPKEFDRVAELKRMLAETGVYDVTTEVIPIVHNKDCAILQFNGFSVNLYKDGTWIVTDTSGG